MIPCLDCSVFFFTPEGREEHNAYCIGYNPTVREGATQKALKAGRFGLPPNGVR